MNTLKRLTDEELRKSIQRCERLLIGKEKPNTNLLTEDIVMDALLDYHNELKSRYKQLIKSI